MARNSSRLNNNTHPKKPQYSNQLGDRSPLKSVCLVSGPGFVVWVSAPNRRLRGFITWSETAVAELSPALRDAWRFPSLKAANDSAARALGPAYEHFSTATFPVDA